MLQITIYFFIFLSDKHSDVDNFIAKSVGKEMETPEASVTPEPDATEQDVNEKFERLNLFFEKNQQVFEKLFLYQKYITIIKPPHL